MISELEIEAIVSLPRNIFEGTTAKTAILMGRKNKAPQRNRVTLISIESRGDLGKLAGMRLEEIGHGIKVEVESIRQRMEPEYHQKGEAVRDFLQNSGINFRPLKDLATIRNGFTGYGDYRRMIYGKGDVRLITAKNVFPYGLTFCEKEFWIDKNELLYRERANAVTGEVLFVRVGAGCIGRAACIWGPEVEGQADDWMFIIKPQTIDPFFLAMFLNSAMGRSFYRS